MVVEIEVISIGDGKTDRELLDCEELDCRDVGSPCARLPPTETTVPVAVKVCNEFIGELLLL